jgi:iron complex outermembrane receptor protein
MKNTNLLWASASLCIVLQTASAEERVINFSIPPQSAATALDALAMQSDLQMLFNRDALKNSTTQGLTGRFTAREALKKLLLGTGLTYTFTADDAVAVKPAPEQLNKADPTTLKPVNVTAKANRDVTDPYNQDYVLPNATAGTKTDTPIMETPLNAQVISKQVMKDQQVVTLNDALKNVSGVTTTSQTSDTGGGNQMNNVVFLRGFSSETFFRDGFRLQYGGSSREMANIESIEVLKGPAAILYGMVDPGGMVNVVTKKPLATPYYAATQQFGSYNLYRTTIDATGPLTKDDTLLYRANLSYQNSGSFRDFAGKEDVFFAPVLTWNISPRTQANFELEYNHQHLGMDTTFVPMINNTLLHIPRSRNYGEYSPAVSETIYGGFNWSHQFNDNWSVKHRFSVNQMRNDMNHYVYPFFSDNTSVSRLITVMNRQVNTYATNFDVTGHFDTGRLKHTLLFGGDFYNTDWTTNTAYNIDPSYNIDFSTINIDNPVHPGTPFTKPINPYSSQNIGSDQFGMYIQDQIKLPYNLHVMGGIRYQNIHLRNSFAFTQDFGGSVTDTPSSADAVTPRVGILWQPQNWLSLYANYVESFGANYGNVYISPTSSRVVPPSGAVQYEGGIKTEFFDGRLRANVAYYDLTKTNVATGDPAHSGFSLVAGAVRSRGPELDIQGEILPGWNVIATYSNTDIRALKSNDAYPTAGSRYYGVPRNMGSLWNTYDFQQEPLRGFKIGGGVTLRDSQLAYNQTNPGFTVPGYTTVDLLAAYSIKVGKSKITAQLNVNNLLDKYYLTSLYTSDAPQQTYANFGMPRNFMGSVSIQY